MNLQTGFCLRWWRFGGQAKTIGIKRTRLSPTAKALTERGFTLTCTALIAISTMPLIVIGRHAARRQPVTLATEWATIAATLLASKRA